MTLYKIVKKALKEKHYAKDRKDIRRLTGLSDASISKIMAKLYHIDTIVTTRQFIIEYVEIDETSIKEIQK